MKKIDWHVKPTNGSLRWSFEKTPDVYNNFIETSYVWTYNIRSASPGFGTLATGYIISKGLKKNYHEYRLDAAWNSFLFHLYMGYLPLERNLSCVPVLSQKAVGKLISKKFDDLNEDDIEDLDELFKDQHGLSDDEAAPMTKDEIIDNIDFFIEINNKTRSYIKTEFIFQLNYYLSCLSTNENTLSGNFFNGGVFMRLSEEGLERWRETITSGSEFKPFHDLHHLHAFMDEETKVDILRLLNIIQERKKSISPALVANSALFDAKKKTEIEVTEEPVLQIQNN